MVGRSSQRLRWLLASSALIALSVWSAELTEEQRRGLLLLLLRPDAPIQLSIGDDRQVVAGSAATLQSSITGLAYTYAWDQTGGPAAVLSGADSPTLQITWPSLIEATEFSFQLVVSYGTQESYSDEVTLTVHPNQPPGLAIDFPCDGCRSYGPDITVRGSADPGIDDDYVSALDGVTLEVDAGGIAVEAEVDESGCWRVLDLPVPQSTNSYTLTIRATDAFGAETVQVMGLERAPTFDAPIMAMDPANRDVIYALESNWVDRLVRIDLDSGGRTTIHEQSLSGFGQVWDGVILPDGSSYVFGELSTGRIGAIDVVTGHVRTVTGPNVGAGPQMESPSRLAVDSDDDRLAVWDWAHSTLFSVDLSTGNRTLLVSGSGVGGAGLAVDSENDIAYVADSSLRAVDLNTGVVDIVGPPATFDTATMDFHPTNNELGAARVGYDLVRTTDLDSGISTDLSDASDGFAMGSLTKLMKDPFASRYLVSDFSINSTTTDTEALVAVDATDGARSVVLRDEVGSGPKAQGRAVVALGQNANVFAASEHSDNVIEIDLTDGTRTLISDSINGFGPSLHTPMAIEVLSQTHLLVVDWGLDALLIVDRATGDRNVISGPGVGTGPAMLSPAGMAVDAAGNRVFVVDVESDSVIEVDLATGNRTTLSDSENDGPALIYPVSIVLDEANGRLLVGDSGTGATITVALLAVDLTTGNRTTLSSSAVGSGPWLRRVSGVDVTGDGTEAYVSTGEQFFRIDLATGDRELVSDSQRGTGDWLAGADAVLLNEEQNLLVSWGLWFEALLVIDIGSGDRVIRSK